MVNSKVYVCNVDPKFGLVKRFVGKVDDWHADSLDKVLKNKAKPGDKIFVQDPKGLQLFFTYEKK